MAAIKLLKLCRQESKPCGGAIGSAIWGCHLSKYLLIKMDDVAFSVLAILQTRKAIEPVKETSMKTSFRWMNALRAVSLVAAGLALYLPAMNLPQGTAVAGQAESEVKLPAGIVLASAQTSWNAVFASGY